MFQNVSQNRENKKITISDFKKIAGTCTSLMFQDLKLSSSFFPATLIFYVVGTGSNKCKVIWEARVNYYGGDPNQGNVNTKTATGDDLTAAWSSIFHPYAGCQGRIKTEILATKLYPNLTINSGEYKIILEVGFYSYFYSLSLMRKLGFWILIPKFYPNYTIEGTILGTIVIFTPKPGLFDETPPQ
jgi:hypothetical protein